VPHDKYLTDVNFRSGWSVGRSRRKLDSPKNDRGLNVVLSDEQQTRVGLSVGKALVVVLADWRAGGVGRMLLLLGFDHLGKIRGVGNLVCDMFSLIDTRER